MLTVNKIDSIGEQSGLAQMLIGNRYEVFKFARAIEAEVMAEPVCPAPACDECNERGACTQEETLAEREEVRAEAQEPVAWFAFADSNGPVPLELWGFDEKACKHAVLENARSVGWKGTVEGYLFQKSWTIRPLVFAAQQPPAPCPDCEGWVINCSKLGAEIVEQARRETALQAKVAQQAERIAEVETQRDNYCSICVERSQTIADQAALIEQCKRALVNHRNLTRPIHETEEALAAIAAYKAA